MIHCFAVEPEVCIDWAKPSNFRYIVDKFGIGTPRVIIEIPKYSKWVRSVHALALEMDLSQFDKTRLTELCKMLGRPRARRVAQTYDPEISWLENARSEYDRASYRGVIAMRSAENFSKLLLAKDLGVLANPLWDLENGDVVERSASKIVKALSSFLVEAKEIHIVDPHFAFEKARCRILLEELSVVATRVGCREVSLMLHVHGERTGTFAFFEQQASEFAKKLPIGCTVKFSRWLDDPGGERFHNRYVLTDLGGVKCGDGIEDGQPGQTDDFNILSIAQYEHRWKIFVQGNGLKFVDAPSTIHGTKQL